MSLFILCIADACDSHFWTTYCNQTDSLCRARLLLCNEQTSTAAIEATIHSHMELQTFCFVYNRRQYWHLFSGDEMRFSMRPQSIVLRITASTWALSKALNNQNQETQDSRNEELEEFNCWPQIKYRPIVSLVVFIWKRGDNSLSFFRCQWKVH